MWDEDTLQVKRGIQRWLLTRIEDKRQSLVISYNDEKNTEYDYKVAELEELMAELEEVWEHGYLPWEVIERENPTEHNVLGG